jgi:hypothetical protein
MTLTRPGRSWTPTLLFPANQHSIQSLSRTIMTVNPTFGSPEKRLPSKALRQSLPSIHRLPGSIMMLPTAGLRKIQAVREQYTAAVAFLLYTIHYIGIFRMYILHRFVTHLKMCHKSGDDTGVGQFPLVPVSSYKRSLPHWSSNLTQPSALGRLVQRRNAHDDRGDGMAVAAAPGVNGPVQRTGAPRGSHQCIG